MNVEHRTSNVEMINLSIKVTKDESAKLLALRGGMAKLLPALGRAFASGALEVLGRAVKNRFSGRGPYPVAEHRLGQVSKRLRESLRATPLQVNASTGTASISMGSNVKYYRGHEFGFRGRVQVKSHTRRGVGGNMRRDVKNDWTSYRGKLTRKTSANLKRNYRRGRANYVQVRAHNRRMNIPARAPLGTELRSIETRLTFFKKFNAAIRRLLSN